MYLTSKKGPYIYTREKPNHVSAGKIHHAPIRRKDYSLRPVIPNSNKIHISSGPEPDTTNVVVKTFGYVPPKPVYVLSPMPEGRVYDSSKYDTDTDDRVIQGKGVTL